MANFIEAQATDLHYPGLTNEEGNLLRRFVSSEGKKYYKVSDLSEVLMDHELEDLQARVVDTLSEVKLELVG